MHIIVFGLNHNTAPVEIREKLYCSDSDIPLILQKLKDWGLHESVVISTCNRTEIYFCSDDSEESTKRIEVFLMEHFGVALEWLKNYTYRFEDEEAYRHLFLVASGLDSMVIGEPQILGQVKDAYRAATSHNTTDFFLDKVFHKTFNVAKRIRTETKIGYNPLSISSMAIELSKKIFGELNRKKILVIGAGEMCEIAMKYFKKEGLSEIFITNRTLQNAQKLAENITGIPCPFQEIPDLLTKVDMVLSSTGSERPIIDKELIISLMKKRKNRPLFLIDIAVPRDIDPEVNHIENVYLYDVDDLKELSQQHLSDRIKESEKAHAIIEKEVVNFSHWLKQLEKNPLITHIIDVVEETRINELKKMIQKMKNTDEETLKSMDLLTKNIVNKLIHRHISLIRQDGSPSLLEIMKQLFKFEEENEKETDSRNEGE
jgi:glutamyl-tRNA reductase